MRASYDQYFMGLERLVPSDARRDVDRRIRVLRTENIRNTATRFRFQQLVQRFVTYTGYWDRVTRQIEEGTFKRDVDRARRRSGAAAAPQRAVEIDLDFDVELEVAGEGDDLDAAINRAIRDAEEEEQRLSLTSVVPEPPSPPPAPAPPPVPRDAGIRAAVFTDEDFAAIDSAFDSLLRESLPPAVATRAPRPGAAPDTASPSTGTQASPQGGAPLTDTTARKPSARFSRPKELDAAPTAPAAPIPVRPATPAAAPPAPAVRAAPPAAPASPLRAASLLDDDDGPSEGPATDKTTRPALTPASPAPAARPNPVPIAPQSNAARPAAPQRPSPSTAVRPPAAASRPAGSGASVDDETRRVYARYVEMRRACNEPTDNVRIESLAKNLEAIRQKHGGRDIGFEVVVKDGRAAIKPVKR
ncbi:MAG: hypothetical protein IT379_35830 [Deltaproteobacteria bacterium]|nr:hypothetical protein [Deltaproteobacteria bacterium]